ncbi:MAG: hypothetical protein J6D36_04710 [Erysipelotrichaceae bacterium]|nr:hypothetical protein [Erysipelotrichaceae bacterium]
MRILVYEETTRMQLFYQEKDASFVFDRLELIRNICLWRQSGKDRIIVYNRYNERK